MSEDYQRYVEQMLRTQTHVAVADLGRNETMYVWHTGDRYKSVTRSKQAEGGYEWDKRQTISARRRSRIIKECSVAVVDANDVPNTISALLRSHRDGEDGDRVVAELMAEMDGMD